MSEQSSTPESSPSASNRSIPWIVAAAIAILALLGGVFLGRVAFVSEDKPSPRVVSIEVLDETLEVGGSVEYLEDPEVYVLRINTLPPAPEGQVFQVWMQIDDLVVPAGVMNPDSRSFAYSAHSGRYDTLFVTVEPGPFGSEQPTTEPVITAALTETQSEDDD